MLEAFRRRVDLAAARSSRPRIRSTTKHPIAPPPGMWSQDGVQVCGIGWTVPHRGSCRARTGRRRGAHVAGRGSAAAYLCPAPQTVRVAGLRTKVRPPPQFGAVLHAAEKGPRLARMARPGIKVQSRWPHELGTAGGSEAPGGEGRPRGEGISEARSQGGRPCVPSRRYRQQ
jgi:hypothetical protein